ncbi:LOW QUALITY PROTEIN: hypothetical protein T265_13059, partial [Opisthorchis viverrini]
DGVGATVNRGTGTYDKQTSIKFPLSPSRTLPDDPHRGDYQQVCSRV